MFVPLGASQGWFCGWPRKYLGVGGVGVLSARHDLEQPHPIPGPRENGCAQGPYRLEDPRADLKEQLAGAEQVQLKRRANRPASGCGGFCMGWSTYGPGI